MLNLKSFYKKYYYISPLDFAEYSESNRSINSFWSIFCFFIVFIFIILYLTLYNDNQKETFAYLTFFGLAAIDCLFSHLISKQVRNVPREKAYILKNIPLYMVFCSGSGGSAFIFYSLDNHWKGVLYLIISATIVISVFHISFPFFIIFGAGCGTIIPGINKFFGTKELVSFLFFAIILFTLAFYKRYQEKQYLTLLRKQKKYLEIKTFGNFTPLYEKKVIKFSRTKTTELLAYLIYKNGTSVNTKELLSVLYGDYANSFKYGASLRLLISDLKHTFSELGIQQFFVAEYNNFRINPEVVHCDYYDFLAGDKKAIKSFTGDFMSQYSWAEDTTAFLERKAGLSS